MSESPLVVLPRSPSPLPSDIWISVFEFAFDQENSHHTLRLLRLVSRLFNDAIIPFAYKKCNLKTVDQHCSGDRQIIHYVQKHTRHLEFSESMEGGDGTQVLWTSFVNQFGDLPRLERITWNAYHHKRCMRKICPIPESVLRPDVELCVENFTPFYADWAVLFCLDIRAFFNSLPASNLTIFKSGNWQGGNPYATINELLSKSRRLHTLHFTHNQFSISFSADFPPVRELCIFKDNHTFHEPNRIDSDCPLHQLQSLELYNISIHDFLGNVDLGSLKGIRKLKLKPRFEYGDGRYGGMIANLLDTVTSLDELYIEEDLDSFPINVLKKHSLTLRSLSLLHETKYGNVPPDFWNHLGGMTNLEQLQINLNINVRDWQNSLQILAGLPRLTTLGITITYWLETGWTGPGDDGEDWEELNDIEIAKTILSYLAIHRVRSRRQDVTVNIEWWPKQRGFNRWGRQFPLSFPTSMRSYRWKCTEPMEPTQEEIERSTWLDLIELEELSHQEIRERKLFTWKY